MENYQTKKEQEQKSGKEQRPQPRKRIGAEGFGLNDVQQEAIADLWQWQEDSLKSDIVLGGPVNGYNPNLRP